MKNNKTTRFFGEIKRLPNGKFKVVWVDQYKKINQFRTKWTPIDARDFARELNKGELIIN